eukprot:GHVU01099538.1.p2 GENE.GHVU01099538.1~~GHVU01099538.1.p2  ORF type:complete len:125 (-),score=19.96 GHVU01099538.1:1376-1750(-)
MDKEVVSIALSLSPPPPPPPPPSSPSPLFPPPSTPSPPFPPPPPPHFRPPQLFFHPQRTGAAAESSSMIGVMLRENCSGKQVPVFGLRTWLRGGGRTTCQRRVGGISISSSVAAPIGSAPPAEM